MLVVVDWAGAGWSPRSNSGFGRVKVEQGLLLVRFCPCLSHSLSHILLSSRTYVFPTVSPLAQLPPFSPRKGISLVVTSTNSTFDLAGLTHDQRTGQPSFSPRSLNWTKTFPTCQIKPLSDHPVPPVLNPVLLFLTFVRRCFDLPGPDLVDPVLIFVEYRADGHSALVHSHPFRLHEHT